MVLSLNTPPSLLTLLSTEKITLQGDIPKISTHQNIINNSVTSRLVKSLSHFFFFLVKEPKHWSLETAELSLIFLFGMTGMLFDTTLSLSLSLSLQQRAHCPFHFFFSLSKKPSLWYSRYVVQHSFLFLKHVLWSLFHTFFDLFHKHPPLISLHSTLSLISFTLQHPPSFPRSLISLSLWHSFSVIYCWYISIIQSLYLRRISPEKIT